MVNYWEKRYARGGTSGAGSCGRLARYKAAFVSDQLSGCWSVMDMGCGDGHMAGLLNIPQYVGTDVSSVALDRCRRRFKGDETKRFTDRWEKADAAISLDVLQHLTDDDSYHEYMMQLFSAARRKVIIYAPCTDVQPPRCASHVRFRDFQPEIPSSWRLVCNEDNPYAFKGDPQDESYSEFFVYA